MFMLASMRRPPAQRPGPAVAHNESHVPVSFLGRGVVIRGTLEVEGELVIAGPVTGRISALKLVIAAGGHVEGDIVARDVVIAGRLDGRVFAPNVVVEAGAVIEGRIFHTTLTVAEGARVTGRMPWRPVSYFDTLDKLPEVRA
jgi:cytoskeletal protein CcmA (bactofilin family)